MGVMIVMADEEQTKGYRPGDYWSDPIRTEKLLEEMNLQEPIKN